MKLKLQTLGRSDGFNKLMSSLISILVGLLVGGIVVLIVGLVEPKITGSGIWDGIRLIFGGILSTGRKRRLLYNRQRHGHGRTDGNSPGRASDHDGPFRSLCL